MHTAHPDVHEVGLVDGCPQCAEAAQTPWRSLDEAMLHHLLKLATSEHRDLSAARSDTEARAVVNVLNALEHFGRFAEAAPDLALGYLQRWGIYTDDALLRELDVENTTELRLLVDVARAAMPTDPHEIEIIAEVGPTPESRVLATYMLSKTTKGVPQL